MGWDGMDRDASFYGRRCVISIDIYEGVRVCGAMGVVS